MAVAITVVVVVMAPLQSCSSFVRRQFPPPPPSGPRALMLIQLIRLPWRGKQRKHVCEVGEIGSIRRATEVLSAIVVVVAAAVVGVVIVAVAVAAVFLDKTNGIGSSVFKG